MEIQVIKTVNSIRIGIAENFIKGIGIVRKESYGKEPVRGVLN